MMGNIEDGRSSKDNRPSLPATLEQPGIPTYSDWAALQAYYGCRVPFPSYYNPSATNGMAPHSYMWPSQQPIMPPYRAPCAAVYPHGGVFPHMSVPIGVSPVNAEPPPLAASGDEGQSLKVKGFDRLAMSSGNGDVNCGSTERDGTGQRSVDTECSSEGSIGSKVKVMSVRHSSIAGSGDIVEQLVSPVSVGDSFPSEKQSEVAVTPNVSGRPTEAATSLTKAPGLELAGYPSNCAHQRASPNGISKPCSVVPSETWLQNERELKREKRKQSNRESARRSRLRKQAEAEELARKVESLSAENNLLKSELKQLTLSSENLRLENTALMEKLKSATTKDAQEIIIPVEDGTNLRATTATTENLLSRVNNSTSIERDNTEEEAEAYDRNSNSGAKLHQLLDSSPRTDAIAAS